MVEGMLTDCPEVCGEGGALHGCVGEEEGWGQVRIAVPQGQPLDVLLGAGTDRHGVVDGHAQHSPPFTAEQHTAPVDEVMEGGDDGETSLQVFGGQTQADTAGLRLVVISVERENLQQVSWGGGPGRQHGGDNYRTGDTHDTL